MLAIGFRRELLHFLTEKSDIKLDDSILATKCTHISLKTIYYQALHLFL